MAVFTNNTPASDYGCILNVGVTNGQVGLTNVLQQIQDAYGNPTPILISTIAVDFVRSGYTFQLDGVAVTAQAVDINSMCQPNPIAKGNEYFLPPIGTTAQRDPVPVAGEFRFNSSTGFFEGYDGFAWVDFASSGTIVLSVSGTSNRITASPTTGNVVVDIAATYVGQSSITTLGTIGTGTWQGSVVSPQYGGTGMNNGANTISLGGTLTTSGPYNAVFNLVGNTNVTFPTSGILATVGGANVESVTGTAGQIDASPTTGNVIVSIDAGYVGQTSITTLGTITSGTWDATTVAVAHGGTSVTSLAAYSLVCGGTTNTGALQTVAAGTAGYVLTYVSSSALPTWQALDAPTWVFQTTTPETLAPNTALIADTAGLLTFNMPATVPAGSVFAIAGYGAGGWTIQLSAGQTIIDNHASSTSGGSASSSYLYNSITLLCLVANTTFSVIAGRGVITYA